MFAPGEKKRGRPKGSKNKTSAAANNEEGAKSNTTSNLRIGSGRQQGGSHTKASHQYNYTPLAKTSLGNTELYNLYGIVIDATSPHQKKQFYRQLLKIIDPSMHYKHPRDGADPTNGCVSVTFFAPTKEQLPQFKRVGDIIRIHRANIGQYKSYKTFSVNLAFGSSWVIFSGFDTQPPEAIPNHEAERACLVQHIASSSNNFSLQSIDVDIVKKYREWLAEYFETEFNYESTLFMNLNKVREFLLNERSSGGQSLGRVATTYNTPREYDLVVRVDSIDSVPKEKAKEVMTGIAIDEPYTNGFVRNSSVASEPAKTQKFTHLQISDSTTLVFDLWLSDPILPAKLKVGDVIRVKSCVASTNPSTLTTLVQSESTNILQIISQFKLYDRFHSKIENTEFNLFNAILGGSKSGARQVPITSINAEDAKSKSDVPSGVSHDSSVDRLAAMNMLRTQMSANDVLEKPEIASYIQEQGYKSLQQVNLAYILFSSQEEQTQMGRSADVPGLFRVTFSVLGVQPLNLFEVCQLYCAVCRKAFSYKVLSQDDNVIFDPQQTHQCVECKRQILEPIFAIQMLAHDPSLSNLDNSRYQARKLLANKEASKDGESTEKVEQRGNDFVRVLLYTHGGLCSKFFNGISPSNLYRDSSTRMMIERYVRHICRFNIWIEGVVARQEVPQMQGRTISASSNPQRQTVLRLISSKLRPL